MPLTPQQEAEAIQIELELRSRSGNNALTSPTATDEPKPDPNEELKKLWSEAGPIDRIKLLFQRGGIGKKFVQNAGEVVDAPINVALEAGGPAAGQSVGAMTGPFAPAMVPILGGLGGMAGDAIAQARGNEPFSTGRMLGAGVTGAIPGAPLANAGAKQVALAGAKYAAGNLAGKAVETEIDRGELPTAAEAGISAGTGLLGAGLGKLFSKASPAAADDLLYASRNKVFEELRKEGVVVPPHELDRGIDAVSSVGGKAALQQQAAKQNQFVWQKLAREEIGLSKEALPISIGDLENVRAQYGEPYREIQTISTEAKQQIKDRLEVIAKESDPHQAMTMLEEPATKNSLEILGKLAAADVDALKAARFNAQKAYDSFKAGNPIAYDEWVAQRDLAEKLESQIEEAAASLRDSTLSTRLKVARKKIAQTYSIQDSLNRATGLVDPVYLGRQLDRGDALSGNLKKIAEFQMAFNREAIDAGRVPSPGVGNLGAMNAMQQASRGNAPGVIGAITGATIGAPTRTYLLSDFMQDSMLNPVERQNFAASFARFLANDHPESRKQYEARTVDTRR